MASHRLDPLIRPRSIAVVGASERTGSVGNEVLVNLDKGVFPGDVFAVNPARDSLYGKPCFKTLSALPGVPDLVVFAIADERLEACLDEAIGLCIPAAMIFSPLYLEDDTRPGLRERVRFKADAAGMLLHGANCMGLYNFEGNAWISGFDTRSHRPGGNVALLSQSGAGMSGILDCEQRIDFCFAASTGQELCLSIEDYLDHVLDLPHIRVVGLFLETSRHPQKFIAALEKACARGIPIVVLKVGRTGLAAELAVSHSGALAGKDASYQAVFDRYGVQRVDDMAQLATALVMFAQPRPVGEGALVTLHDSGGERQLAIDLAQKLEVPLAQLNPQTLQRLELNLSGDLPAVNPLDAWVGGKDAARIMQDSFVALLQDPGAALGAVVHDRAPGGDIYPAYLDYLRAARKVTDKPVFLVSNHRGSGGDDGLITAADAGLPVLDGLREFLVGVRCLLRYRDFQKRDPVCAPQLEQSRIGHWRSILHSGASPGELEAAQLLRDFCIPILQGVAVDSAESVQGAAVSMGYPLVLKTAVAGIQHKSEVKGVVLDIHSRDQLMAAWDEMALRLGPQAIVTPMVGDEGVEMFLGVSRDEQFGPLVIMGMGGVQAELMGDVVSLLPPFGPDDARRALDGLAMRELLDEFRGRPALALEQFCDMAARLSQLAVQLEACVAEIDINPVHLGVDSCIGLDCLLVPVMRK